jgi:hypothetical protein
MKIFFTLALILALAGCASAPYDIQPMYISETKYAPFTREQMVAEQRQIVIELYNLATKQDTAKGRPTGTRYEYRIAGLRGELIALQGNAQKRWPDFEMMVDPCARGFGKHKSVAVKRPAP